MIIREGGCDKTAKSDESEEFGSKSSASTSTIPRYPLIVPSSVEYTDYG